MNEATAQFINAEFNVFSLSLPCVLLYIGIALLMLFLVRILGPVSIKEYRLELAYDDSTGAENIIYRIIAPIIWNFLLLLAIFVLCSLLKIQLYLTIHWMPLAFYWGLMILIKTRKQFLHISIWALLIEAVFSIMIAIYFDWAVVQQFPQTGLLAVDQSNIGFQVILMLFFATVQAIMSLSVKRKYWTSYPTPIRYSSYGYRCHIPTEKQLYSYARKYDAFLPQRFKDDPLLRAVFYSIMFIEDANRPAHLRPLENLLAKLGVAKTTGIMQQKANYPLTDEESIELAIPYIEKMWDCFLRRYARSRNPEMGDPAFTFSSNAYCYTYPDLAQLLDRVFSLLYGDYCGTRFYDVNCVFQTVRHFEEREAYCLAPNTIIGTGSLFPEECTLIPNTLLQWRNENTIEQADRKKALSSASLLSLGSPTTHLTQAMRVLHANGVLPVAISFGPSCYMRIELDVEPETIQKILGPSWSVKPEKQA